MSARRRAVAVAGHRADIAVARDALRDPEPGVRALALGACARARVLTDADVAEALRDESVIVRRRAAELAAARPGVDLRDALDDADPTVVEQAAWACGEQATVSERVLARLVELAGSSTVALVRESAVASLGAIGDDRGLPAILAGCADQPAVRRRAVLALAPFAGPDVDAALERALADRDWQVRQAAEDLLRARS